MSEYKEHYQKEALEFNLNENVKQLDIEKVTKPKQPQQQQQQIKEKRIVNNEKQKEDIKNVLFNSKDKPIDNTDYSLNYNKPSKEAYRIKRNQVYIPTNTNEFSNTASEYKQKFIKF